MKQLYAIKRRTFQCAFFFLLVVLAGMTQATAQTFTVGDLNYTINEDGNTVTLIGHVDGFSGELVIPESVELYGSNYPVTWIGEYAFSECSGLTGSLVIPNSVNGIDMLAFCYTNIESLDLGASLSYLGYGVFMYCSNLTEVTIPSQMTFIGERVFGSCSNITTLNYNAVWLDACLGEGWYHWLDETSVNTLNIGYGVQHIPCCFLGHGSGPSIEQVVIPESVTSIGDAAFYHFSGSVNIPSSVVTISERAFIGCTGLTGSLNLPETLTSIGAYAFYNCTGLTGSLSIPNNVTSIGGYAFAECPGFSGALNLGASLNHIDEWAFFGFMDNVSEINLMAPVPPSLGNSVFLGAAAGIPINVPCGTLENYQNASDWNSFTNIQEMDPCQWRITATTHPNTGVSISGTGTYIQGQTCTLTAVGEDDWSFVQWIEDGVVVSTNASYSFIVEDNRHLEAYFTNPNYITFADYVVEARCLELWDADGDGFLSYEEAATVTDLEYAFYYWTNIISFDELQYFTGLTHINDDEFIYCRSLSSLVIPENISFIGGWSFAYCNSLTSLTLLSSIPPEINGDAFSGTDLNNVVVTVPCGMTSVYQSADVWDWFTSYDEPDTCFYDITLAVDPEEAGTVNGAGSYQRGTDCNLVATPANGCTFLYWTEEGVEVSTDMDYSFRVTCSRSLVAHFQLPSYSISVTANPSEGGEVLFNEYESPYSYDFEDGTMQGWTTIDADGDGYNWRMMSSYSVGPCHNGSSDGVYSQSYVNNHPLNPDNYLVSPRIPLGCILTFYACAQNATWAAEHFGVAVSVAGNIDPSDFTTIQEWTMSAKGSGTPEGTTRGGNRAQGRWYQYSVDLSAYAGQEGYVAIRHFDCSDMYYLDIDDIVFSYFPYTYQQGSTCSLTATPNYGYMFVNWEENGQEISTEPDMSFVVMSDRDLVANFAKVPFEINGSANFEDRGLVEGAGEYVLDASCTLTAIPNTGHNFVRWEENGAVVSTDASYTFTVTGPRELMAVFTAHVDDIIVFADPNVKAVCVSHWDTDGDDEITYAEAAAVTDLGQVFYHNYDITSFDELQYFTGLTYINNKEFYLCHNLQSIVLPETVISIGSQAFINTNLGGSLTIGENVTSIGWGAFFGTSFSTIHYNAVNCEMGGQWIDVGTASLTAITIGERVEVLPVGIFMDCYNVTGELVIPNSVNYIGAYAFNNCSSLTAVTLPEGIAEIADGVFNGCSSMVTVNIPNSVETIGAEAFYACNSLENLSLPSSLTFIGSAAFEYCYSLSGILEIPASVTYIGAEAFMDCTGLSGLVLPPNIQSIDYRAFKNCSGLRGELTLPESLEMIGNNAFYGCDGISKVNFNAVNCLGMGNAQEPVFYDCAFTQLNIGADVQNIPNFAFKRCFSITEMNVAAVTPPTIYSSTFGMVPRSIPVMVPVGSGDAYRYAPYWEEFFNITEGFGPTALHYHFDMHQYSNNMSLVGVVQINGEEQSSAFLEVAAFCGDECRGSQLLTSYSALNRSLLFLTLYGEDGDIITFRLYDHNTGEESTLACSSIINFVSDGIVGSYNDPQILNFVSVQNTLIETGWNWLSVYIDQPGATNLQMMEESLGQSGVMIKSHADGFLSYDESGWTGTLNSVVPESMYMVNTSAPVVLSILGPYAAPADHPVTLSSGWTWVGYPSVRPASVNSALSGYTPQDGDLIKAHGFFSQYAEGVGWTGALNVLQPGMGLMYHSLNSGETVLTYNVDAKETSLEVNHGSQDNHWVPDVEAYPFNMSVVAVVELDGLETRDSRFELAAFENNECRGSARLMYVRELDRYIAFLTVFGDDDAELSWALYDTETGEEYRSQQLSFRFEQDAILGSVKAPEVINFTTFTQVSDTALEQVRIYPNPVARNQYVHLSLPAVQCAVTTVEIVDALGSVVASMRMTGMTDEVKAPAVSGVYVVKVMVDGKGVVCSRLIVE